MHLIEKHHIEARCNQKEFGHHMKDEIAAVFEFQLYPELERLLDRYDNPLGVYEIELLPVEISLVATKNWREELVRQSLSQIENFLLENALHGVGETEDVSQNKGIKNYDKYIFVQDLFLHYLKTGQLSVNPLSDTLDDIFEWLEFPDSFIQKLIEFVPEDIDRVLRWNFNIPKDLKKRFLSFSEGSISIDSLESLQNEWEEIYSKSAEKQPQLKEPSEFTGFIEFLFWISVFISENTTIEAISEEKMLLIAKDYFQLSQEDLVLLLNTLMELESAKKTHGLVALIERVLNQEKKIGKDVYLKEKKAPTEINKIDAVLDAIEQANNEKVVSKNNAAVYINNAGLVLIHPFLVTLFQKLNYLDDTVWKSKKLQHRAVLIVQYLVNFEEHIFESDLLVGKIFCGVPLLDSVSVKWKITPEEDTKCRELLQSVVEHWSILKNTSVKALQETFIQRKGKLVEYKEDTYEITVEQQSIDLLLDQLPWGIGTIKTPWMENYLSCYWN